MKRIAIALFLVCVTAFAFAQGGFGLDLFVAGGFAEPGLVGSSVLAYGHNTTGHGFDVKLGARKPLADFFDMPSYLPITAQVALGYQHNVKKGGGQVLNAAGLNIDALYNLSEVLPIPYVAVSPFLGIKYDAQIYETFNAHLLGAQVGLIVGYGLDMLLEGLGVELVMGQTFDFDVTGTFTGRGGNVATGVAYVNLGVSYALSF